MAGNTAPVEDPLRRKARRILGRLTPEEREALLIRCWMSHDAYWFVAVAGEYGMQVTNRLNQAAARRLGEAEARRILRAVDYPPARTIDDVVLAQETLIALLGPELLEYDITRLDERACRVDVHTCFAHEHVARAGVLDLYECGIFARIRGWLDAMGLDHVLEPALGPCQKAGGGACAYTLRLVEVPNEQ